MACTRVDTSFGHMVLCDFVHSTRTFNVRGETITMEFHNYLGPMFSRDGEDFYPDESDDELWGKFYRWLERYERWSEGRKSK